MANREHDSCLHLGDRRGKKQQYDELKGFNKCNPLINDDKDVNK